jgi:hypothetical protein
LPAPVECVEYAGIWQKRRFDVRIRADRTLDIRVNNARCHVRVNMDERVVEPDRWETFGYDPAITFWAAIGRKGNSNDA